MTKQDENEGDVELARASFLKTNHNLSFLLNKRFSWMNNYISNGMKVIELGSGTGLLRHFIDYPVILSDVIKRSYIDETMLLI